MKYHFLAAIGFTVLLISFGLYTASPVAPQARFNYEGVTIDGVDYPVQEEVAKVYQALDGCENIEGHLQVQHWFEGVYGVSHRITRKLSEKCSDRVPEAYRLFKLRLRGFQEGLQDDPEWKQSVYEAWSQYLDWQIENEINIDINRPTELTLPGLRIQLERAHELLANPV